MRPGTLRPISLLRLSLLRFVGSKFPGNSPMDMRIPPLKLKILLESNPLKSRILVRRFAVHPSPRVRSLGKPPAGFSSRSRLRERLRRRSCQAHLWLHLTAASLYPSSAGLIPLEKRIIYQWI